MAHSTVKRVRINHYWFYRLFLIGWERDASFSLTNHEVSNGNTKANGNNFRHSSGTLLLIAKDFIQRVTSCLLVDFETFIATNSQKFSSEQYLQSFICLFSKSSFLLLLVRRFLPSFFCKCSFARSLVLLFFRLFVFCSLVRPSVHSFGHVSVRLSGLTRNCSSSVTVRKR